MAGSDQPGIGRKQGVNVQPNLLLGACFRSDEKVLVGLFAVVVDRLGLEFDSDSRVVADAATAQQ
jgi:hypothetical protein